MKLKSLLLAGVIIATSGAANAGFLATDWKKEGDKKATLHEETGLEWLDLTVTKGQSLSQVESLLDSTYSGWRLPTREEVNTLMQGMFAEVTSDQSNFSQQTNKAYSYNGYKYHQFNAYLGDPTIGSAYSVGLYYNDEDKKNNGELSVLYSGMNYGSTSVNSYMNTYSNKGVSNNLSYNNGNFSVFLVSDGGTTLDSIENPEINLNNPNAPINSVPLTGSLLLLLAGTLGLQRRKALL